MHQEVLADQALPLIDRISQQIHSFYLAGRTGLALQLGHRVSEDLDFFSKENFETENLEASIIPDKVISARTQTLHCIKEAIRLSFIFYEVPLRYSVHHWKNINIAAWQDIVAEKIKTVSQRGAKKDFWDVYSVIRLNSSIEEVSALFLERFKDSGINVYHVLKSLVYFEDAENEPDPVLLHEMKTHDWNQVKRFFEENIRKFEKALLI